ncbi:MAG: alanine racemase, partial [Micrococcales bacterium]|nr:alanine racemase [Micrococcales bacterium]
VKADAYGHGMLPAARAALAGGATWLGVAQSYEALALRAAGIVEPRILTWLYAPGAPLADVLAADVDISVAARWALDEVVAAARAQGVTARVHLKIDTGLGRNGLTPPQLDDLLPALMRAQADHAISVVGVWSHLAFADAPDHPTVRAQAVVFEQAVAATERAGAHLEVRHLANSAAVLRWPSVHYDLVRPGLSVYGLSPIPDQASPQSLGLVPAMTLQAHLATVKPVPAGQGLSYSHQYVTTCDTTVGIVPLGYADGIPRHASGTTTRPGGPVQINGRRLAVAGRVCMDQVVVDLGPDAREAAGDLVTVFGPGDHGEPTAQDWADVCGTISYEIVTRLGAQVPREYV